MAFSLFLATQQAFFKLLSGISFEQHSMVSQPTGRQIFHLSAI
jgi:hypothetical protein